MISPSVYLCQKHRLVFIPFLSRVAFYFRRKHNTVEASQFTLPVISWVFYAEDFPFVVS